MIPPHLLMEEPAPVPAPDDDRGHVGTICDGADLHQLVAPGPDGSIIGDLIQADHPDCPGYVPEPKPKPIITKSEAVAVGGIGALLLLFG